MTKETYFYAKKCPRCGEMTQKIFPYLSLTTFSHRFLCINKNLLEYFFTCRQAYLRFNKPRLDTFQDGCLVGEDGNALGAGEFTTRLIVKTSLIDWKTPGRLECSTDNPYMLLYRSDIMLNCNNLL